jgi:hypothetical protein
MLRNRLLILLGGCLLAASAGWADDVGYIDCGGHPDPTQVFAKARQTHETVASLACGERFTILQYGFIFSRIQTRDGKVGYVYSNAISVDRSGASAPPPTSARLPAATPGVPATTGTVAPPSPTAAAQPQATPAQLSPTAAIVVQPNPATPAPTQATPAQPVPTQAPTATSNPASTPVTDIRANPATPAQPQSAPVQPAPATTSSVPETPANQSTLPTQPQVASAQLAATEATAPTASVPEVAAAAQPAPTSATQPDATPAAQPERAPAEVAAPTVRPASARESWEKPNAGIRTIGPRRMPLIELFGGYGFARLDGGGTWSNLSGAVGSFGWNVKPWLQIVADTSYDFVTVGGTKTILYGNHYGPRLFGHMRNRWGITPFVEGLVGGSRADVTVSGTGGYTTSENSISYKVGGGLDIKPSRRFEIRLIDVDYYRTSFGTNVHQNNYWASAGIVIRLFGGSE